MIEKIKTGLKWLVYSSADANNISRTVKGAGLTIITVLVASSPLTHIQWSTPELSAVLDQSITVINSGFAFIAALWTVYGLIRKIVLTIEDKNATLQ